jgi:hypothetical protein
MKDIVDITVTQIRVYPVDSLPYAPLRLATNTKAIKEAFHFESVQIDPLGGQIVFSNGVFEQRGKSAQLLSLTIEQRRLAIQIRGRSPLANAFYSAFSTILKGLSKECKAATLEPLLEAEETACVASLNIDFDELIAPSLLKFIQGEAKERLRTSYGVPKSIAFKNLTFEVKYNLANPNLEEHEVALSNKLLTIEPRLATPMRERRFYTISPTDSETHIGMLESLEKEIIKVRQKNR